MRATARPCCCRQQFGGRRREPCRGARAAGQRGGLSAAQDRRPGRRDRRAAGGAGRCRAPTCGCCCRASRRSWPAWPRPAPTVRAAGAVGRARRAAPRTPAGAGRRAGLGARRCRRATAPGTPTPTSRARRMPTATCALPGSAGPRRRSRWAEPAPTAGGRRSCTATTGMRRWPTPTWRAAPGRGGVKSVYTVHNLAYQGLFDGARAGRGSACRRRCSIRTSWSSTASFRS